jgi:hypothetical protein
MDERRAAAAARAAIASPLLEVSIEGARAALFNITGPSDITLFEVQEAAEVIAQAVHPDANIFFGCVVDPHLEQEVRITLIATRLDGRGAPAGSEQVGRVAQGRAERLGDMVLRASPEQLGAGTLSPGSSPAVGRTTREDQGPTAEVSDVAAGVRGLPGGVVPRSLGVHVLDSHPYRELADVDLLGAAWEADYEDLRARPGPSFWDLFRPKGRRGVQ